MTGKENALLDIRVLDLSRVLAGPFCSMLLADLGAEVIKLEIPQQGDDSRGFPPFIQGESLYYMNLNRGKQSITLNLKHSEGKKIFLNLVKQCDVLIENFRPGTMKRLGLSYEELEKENERLVYASISGFGQYGPYKERAGYDIIGQAMGGLLSITGWPDGPPTRSGTAIGDILSSLFCTIGILAALKIREKTGKGQLVDVSLVDSVFASLENIPQRYFAEGVIPSRIGNRYEFVYPYDSFETKDGFVIIGIANDSIWRRFVEATRIQQIDDKKYYTNALRVENHESLKPLIEGWTKKRGKNEIIDILNNNGIPSSPIYDIKNIVGDEHIAQAREMVLEQDQPGIGKIKVLGNPIKMSRTRPAPRGPAPRLGENTESVLLELLEVTGQEYKKLVHKKVI